MTPQDLLAAYIETTGLPVSLSYERQRALAEAVTRGITPDDIRAVGKELKKLLATGTKGYTPSSLDFRDFMGNLDTLEERCLRLRQRLQRTKRPVNVPPSSQMRVISPDESVSVLAERLPDTEVSRADAAQALRAMANQWPIKWKGKRHDGNPGNSKCTCRDRSGGAS